MSTQKAITIKLLVDKKANKVLFAEAEKDFVDFLFGILILPLASVNKILTKKEMSGCIGDLYESVENLGDTYIQPNQNKDTILKPITLPISYNIPFLTPNDAVATSKYFKCSTYNHVSITSDPQTPCPQCRSSMSTKVTYVAPKSAEQGFVKGLTTYMVTDSLAVTPMATISSISVLKELNVPDLNSLQEMEVDVGMEEGMRLLKVALQSKTALSEVFLWEEVEVELSQLDTNERSADDDIRKNCTSNAPPPPLPCIPAMAAPVA